MSEALQKLSKRLKVTSFEEIFEALNFFPEHESPPSDPAITAFEVGAIISVESHRRETKNDTDNYSRLAVPRGINAPHYLTTLFHVDVDDDDGRRDLLLNEKDPAVLNKRAAALADTLDIARVCLAGMEASGETDKKLVVHCIRGLHRSPVLMLAIMIDQLPYEPLADIVEALAKDVTANRACLRTGELAFIDAYFRLDGKLADVCNNRPDQIWLDRTGLDQCLQRFNAAFGPQGASMHTVKLQSIFNPTL